MTTCRRAARWMQLSIDDRLSPGSAVALERHLTRCARCRADFQTMRIIAFALRENDDVAAQPDLAPVIMLRIARLEALKARHGEEQGLLRWADALLATLLASVFTLAFVLADPRLRDTFPSAFSHSFPVLVAALSTPGPGSIAWVAWAVWIGTGVSIAIWLAGPDARSSWRDTLAQRLPH